ncbi:RusA family crossover junction endodeoxyribonuclease [Paracoccus sp. PAR01]|uniref:RusA family crossover junction endodeoxyribonuclease n=1 Tax=Paracoccus sp. PAR01 TaxID=2769282 RepID=UPI00177EAF88|nr:RusA family crossover junction endodeoxyribonuclease [Paracoccus sp. PAR01]MBD9528403.1 RusA family crossover junction endodeoxyribonuclease [Paracoccus sp. PAR01]
MTVYRFTIPGKPYAKRRPRAGYSPKLGRSITFNAPGNAEAEVSVAHYAGQAIPAPIEGPVRVQIVAVFEIPKSWSKKRQREALGTLHTSKPDFDNLCKNLCDGMNRIAWRDDSQVADVRTVKIWGERNETLVEVGPCPRAFSGWQQNDYRDLRDRIVGDEATDE